MKTSSLIVTYNDLLTTGGHNLSSRISRVNSMTHYKRTRNYTPTDYERPADTPSPNIGGEPDSKSSGKKPSVSTTPAKKKTNNSSNQATKQSSSHSGNQTIKQSSNNKVRSRSAVIPATPRRTRGL